MRGSRVSMIFQEPMTSLNPVFTVGEQIVEAIRYHGNASAREAKDMAIEMLSKVQFPEPETVFNEYPHRLSGGMRQRAMIAMALCLKPDLLIADEPTTALDVTIQEEIIKLIRELKESLGAAVLLITHNLGLVYNNADFIGVMYAGKLVEEAGSKALFKNPLHPYTLKLLCSIPDVSKRQGSLDTIPGAVPPATSYAEGCRFSGRCQSEMQGCAKTEPLLKEIGQGHKVACHLYDMTFMASPDSSPVGRATEAPLLSARQAKGTPLTSILSPTMPTSSYPSPFMGAGLPLRLYNCNGKRGVGAGAGRGSIMEKELILEVRDLKTYYPIKKGLFKRTTYVKAVDGISFSIRKGMTLALVGESGCGKTTAGKTILR
ncbi:MAG: oligopeptide/dipeptide ABC transporter ATP-binding protein, partial [Deltaproteobacteria bacterium]